MRRRILDFGLWIERLLLSGLLLGLMPLLAGEEASQWHMLIEPKFIKHAVALPIPGSERAELVPALWKDGDVVLLEKREFESLNVDLKTIQQLALQNAAEELKKLTPEFSRNSKNVIQFATLASNRPLTASAVLAPDFLKTFEKVFGPEILIAIPNRYCVFIFPKLASDYRDFAPMVLEAYKSTPYPVSREIFELSASGLKAVGIYEEP